MFKKGQICHSWPGKGQPGNPGTGASQLGAHLTSRGEFLTDADPVSQEFMGSRKQ